MNLPSFEDCTPQQKLNYYNNKDLWKIAKHKNIKLTKKLMGDVRFLIQTLQPIITENDFIKDLRSSNSVGIEPSTKEMFDEKKFNRLLLDKVQRPKGINNKFREIVFRKNLHESFYV